MGDIDPARTARMSSATVERYAVVIALEIAAYAL